MLDQPSNKTFPTSLLEVPAIPLLGFCTLPILRFRPFLSSRNEPATRTYAPRVQSSRHTRNIAAEKYHLHRAANH